MSTNPVQIEIESPRRFDRLQLAIRIVLAIVLAWFGITFGALGVIAYLMLPVLAAIAITSGGGDIYVTDRGPQLWRVLAWMLRFEAYMMLLVDRVPLEENGVSIRIAYSGHPTIRSAMWRLVTSLPLVVVAFVLAIPSGLFWCFAAVCLVLGLDMPRWILAFQLGVFRWHAQLLAYQASLVEPYPRWSFDTATHVSAEAV
jgi:hypothetical protein